MGVLVTAWSLLLALCAAAAPTCPTHSSMALPWPGLGRYEVVPTPLTRLRWWRVVLDEAQMVESSTAKAAEMALKLSTVHRSGPAWLASSLPGVWATLTPTCGVQSATAVWWPLLCIVPPVTWLLQDAPPPRSLVAFCVWCFNMHACRWCVTGTPISRGLEDVQGLMAFLKVGGGEVCGWGGGRGGERGRGDGQQATCNNRYWAAAQVATGVGRGSHGWAGRWGRLP